MNSQTKVFLDKFEDKRKKFLSKYQKSQKYLIFLNSESKYEVCLPL